MKKILEKAEKVRQSVLIRSIYTGLVNMTPILSIGAMSLVLKTFPFEWYQIFINSFLDGFIYEFLDIIYLASFGILSIHMTFFISVAYIRTKGDKQSVTSAAVMSSLIAFFMAAGIGTSNFSLTNTGPKSMFLALITGIGATWIYMRWDELCRKRRPLILSSGADRVFNRMIMTLAPMACTVITFALLHVIVTRSLGVTSIRELMVKCFNWLFSHGNNEYLRGLSFVFLSSILWFFGIHGNDTLEDVAQTYFVPNLTINQQLAAAGAQPTKVLTKQFFDCFVLMGGCGSAICLLIALMLFSKNKAKRNLAYAASFPTLFNINELMIFGLPVIYNLTMVIPFLLVPMVCYTLSYLASSTGFLPLITSNLEWTTPVLISGYIATGSIKGVWMQLINIYIGVLIYMPFVKILDRHQEEACMKEYDDFIAYFKENEYAFTGTTKLTEEKTIYGEIAKTICSDIKYDIRSGLEMAYQPQHRYDDSCCGVEALLRWKHPVFGYLYPPLVFRLAEEGGFLEKMEEAAVEKVLQDREKVYKKYGEGIKISFNVTAVSAALKKFMNFLEEQDAKYSFAGKNLCMEITEQASISFDEETVAKLKRIKALGLKMALDDFSMGSTSVHYLKENIFDIIKLDGNLIKGLFNNKNSDEIILSITQLANSLGMETIAEYVESIEQKERLHDLNCNIYQGYLYSPAELLRKNKKE